MKLDLAASVLSWVSLASAHGAVTSYVIGGKTYDGYHGFSPSSSGPTIQRQWPDYNPIMSSTSPMMMCNGGTSAALSAPVTAGDQVTAVWSQWTHQQGPVMVWLYQCNGEFASCTGTAKRWFKIDQQGMTAPPLAGENWGTAVIYKKLKWSSTIPKSLAPGNYLIRHELLALHQANTPQFYAECAQIVVSGTGTKVPPAEYMYNIPTYAPMSDPGITIDVYSSKATTYKCPGGDVWPGFSS